MIFALFIIMMFVGMLAFVQFGMQVNVESPRAQLYAQNMSVWHQAAMLQLRNPPALFPPGCPPPSSMCAAEPMNVVFWNSTTQTPIASRALISTWEEYRPMVRITNTSGWQSFLLRNIQLDGTTTNGSSYMLTIFRGFGGRNESTAHGAGTEKGGMDEANMVKSLARNVTERVGIGTLVCPVVGSTICSFERVSSEIVPGAPATKQDDRVSIGTAIFTIMPSAATWFPAVGANPAGSAEAVRMVLNGRPAILTRVDSN